MPRCAGRVVSLESAVAGLLLSLRQAPGFNNASTCGPMLATMSKVPKTLNHCDFQDYLVRVGAIMGGGDLGSRSKP